MAKKQTANRRSDGKFAPGNKVGKQFRPGTSGNSAGRPKRTRLSESLTAWLAESTPNASGKTVADAIAWALIQKALKGDICAIREIADRTEGRPRQTVEVDARVMDWREISRLHGLDAQEVIDEARRIIESESATDSSGAESG